MLTGQALEIRPSPELRLEKFGLLLAARQDLGDVELWRNGKLCPVLVEIGPQRIVVPATRADSVFDRPRPAAKEEFFPNPLNLRPDPLIPLESVILRPLDQHAPDRQPFSYAPDILRGAHMATLLFTCLVGTPEELADRPGFLREANELMGGLVWIRSRRRFERQDVPTGPENRGPALERQLDSFF